MAASSRRSERERGAVCLGGECGEDEGGESEEGEDETIP